MKKNLDKKLFVLFAVVMGLLVLAPNSAVKATSTQPKIAFISFRDIPNTAPYEHISSISADGSSYTELASTPSSYGAMDAKWSPDGSKIAYIAPIDANTLSEQMGTYDVFVMNADGSNKVNITNTPSLREVGFSWSPDSNRLLIEAETDDQSCDTSGYYSKACSVLLVNSDASNKTTIYQPSTIATLFAKWSPDGTKIALLDQSISDGSNLKIGDGNGQVLTSVPGIEVEKSIGMGSFDWSPDSTHIIYAKHGGGSTGSENTLNITSLDGSSDETIVTQTPGLWIYSPFFSPDGSKILFEGIDSNELINAYVVSSVGGQSKNITNDDLTEDANNDYWVDSSQWLSNSEVIYNNRSNSNQGNGFYVINIESLQKRSLIGEGTNYPDAKLTDLAQSGAVAFGIDDTSGSTEEDAKSPKTGVEVVWGALIALGLFSSILVGYTTVKNRKKHNSVEIEK